MALFGLARSFLLAALLALFPALAGSTAFAAKAGPHACNERGEVVEWEVFNPYEEVEWDATGHHDANLHTHTHFSDGHYAPHYAIDTYHGMGYEILALTDHDSLHVEVWPKALYPWTELNAIYHEIKDERNARLDKTYGEAFGEEWQDRDPEKLGMVSIPGSEISRTHHISSLFNLYAGGTQSEEEAFMEIGKGGGLAVFNHPGRYDKDLDWYVDFFKRHDHVVGMEVYNQLDRYPVDRTRWDRILYRLMPDRPVWGLANDDTHTEQHFGRNRNIFLLSELTQENVFEAMKKGQFYFFVPVDQGTPPPIRLKKAVAGDGAIRLEIEGDFARIDWITYNPATDESHTVGNGLELSLDDLSPLTTFVRVVVVGETGRTYTQPFGLKVK